MCKFLFPQLFTVIPDPLFACKLHVHKNKKDLHFTVSP
ncbi:hypothetical protein EZS27_013417 [termite gut metagenome]|uniref:Uncharacterized protein n=1 Tax=termite gut metagenome TaxID=433724 RepID=A0A5J4RZY4_9ZZZZ